MARGIPTAGVDDDVIVLGGQALRFGPHGWAGQFDAGIACPPGPTRIAQDGEIGRGLLVICIDEQDIVTALGTENGEMGRHRRFPRAAFDATDDHNHVLSFL